MPFFPADVRLESLDDYSVCFQRESGVTHILDAGAAFVLQQAVSQPGINRDALLKRIQDDFGDDPEALEALLDESLVLLIRQGLLRSAEAPDVGN